MFTVYTTAPTRNGNMNQEADLPTNFSFFTKLLLWLFLLLLALAPAAIYYLRDSENNPNHISVILHSSLRADYSADALPTRPNVSLQLVRDAMRDAEPSISIEDIEARFDDFNNQLLTPVPNVNPSPTPTYVFLPTQTPTAIPTVTPTPIPLPTATPPPILVTHIIQQFDTFYELSQIYNTTVEELMRLNPSATPERLRIGDPLILPVTSTP